MGRVSRQDPEARALRRVVVDDGFADREVQRVEGQRDVEEDRVGARRGHVVHHLRRRDRNGRSEDARGRRGLLRSGVCRGDDRVVEVGRKESHVEEHELAGNGVALGLAGLRRPRESARLRERSSAGGSVRVPSSTPSSSRSCPPGVPARRCPPRGSRTRPCRAPAG